MGCATSIADSKTSNNNTTQAVAGLSDNNTCSTRFIDLSSAWFSKSKVAVINAKNIDQATAELTTANTWDDDPYVTREIVLTEQQKSIIIKNWQVVSSDLIGRGSRIFQLIFARNPRLRVLFACGHLHGEELVNDPRFKGHALRFMQAVGAVVDNLDNYNEVLSPLLNDLGRKHVSFKGFKPIYFNDFQESIMQIYAEDLGSKFNAQAREAWRLVLLFILTELKRGFTQCLREKSLQHNSSLPVNGADDISTTSKKSVNVACDATVQITMAEERAAESSTTSQPTNVSDNAATTSTDSQSAAAVPDTAAGNSDIDFDTRLAALLSGCKTVAK